MKNNLLLIGMLMCTSVTYAQNIFSMASVHPADTVHIELQEQARLMKLPSSGCIFSR